MEALQNGVHEAVTMERQAVMQRQARETEIALLESQKLALQQRMSTGNHHTQ